MIEALKEEINKSLKEIKEKTIKNQRKCINTLKKAKKKQRIEGNE